MTPSTSRARKLIKAAAALAFWGLVWALASWRVGKELILPSPLDVVKTLGELIVTVPFWLSAGRSVLNVFIGFAIGVAAGTLLAFGTVFIPPMDTLLSPAIRVVRATPVRRLSYWHFCGWVKRAFRRLLQH